MSLQPSPPGRDSDDPVGLVPLGRWDVEGGGGGGHRRALEARFAAFMPGVERFDAQVWRGHGR